MNFFFVSQVVFFITYFVAWLTKELPQTTWISVSAIAALISGILLIVANGAPYLNHRNPQA